MSVTHEIAFSGLDYLADIIAPSSSKTSGRWDSYSSQIIRLIPYALLGDERSLRNRVATLVTGFTSKTIGSLVSKILGGGLLGGIGGIIAGSLTSKLIGGVIDRILGKKKKAPILQLPEVIELDATLNPKSITLPSALQIKPKLSQSVAPQVHVNITGVVGNDYEIADRITSYVRDQLSYGYLAQGGSKLGG